MAQGYCEWCRELVPIEARGMRAGRQRQWVPLPHRVGGELCPGGGMAIEDRPEVLVPIGRG